MAPKARLTLGANNRSGPCGRASIPRRAGALELAADHPFCTSTSRSSDAAKAMRCVLHKLCVDIDLAHVVDDDGDLEAIAVREDVVEKRRLPCAEKPESTGTASLRVVVSVERSSERIMARRSMPSCSRVPENLGVRKTSAWTRDTTARKPSRKRPPAESNRLRGNQSSWCSSPEELQASQHALPLCSTCVGKLVPRIGGPPELLKFLEGRRRALVRLDDVRGNFLGRP